MNEGEDVRGGGEWQRGSDGARENFFYFYEKQKGTKTKNMTKLQSRVREA